jgi:outer membrane protein assembly factor BamB
LNTINQAIGRNPQVAWSIKLGSPAAVLPAITGGSAWLAMHAREHSVALHALNLLDGGMHWSQPLSFAHAMVSGLAPLADGLLVALTSTHRLEGEGALVALDAEGGEHWRWAPGVQRVSAPAIAGDTAYVTVEARSLVAIDLIAGKEKARVDLGVTASLFAPAIEEGVAYVPCRGPHLLAVGLDGELRWCLEVKDKPDTWLDKTPLVAGERVFAVQSDGVVLALHAGDGSLAWRADAGPAGKPLSPPATDGTCLFIGARYGVYALDLVDGREVWHFPTERRVEAAPLVAGDVVYATCHDHRLYALDATTGNGLWQYEMERHIEVPPVLATCGDTPCILVADHGGMLTAIVRPLSAEELEAAGRWLEAAEAYARLDRPLRRALALEQHARLLEGTMCSAREKAAAWLAAAEALEAEGEAERAVACLEAVARCLQQPAIALDVRLDRGLMLKRWSQLHLVVHNGGYGPARNLVIRASGEQFEGQVMHTQRIMTLKVGQTREETLNVRPLQCGDAVPLQMRVHYQDSAGELHDCDQTIHVPVAGEEAARGGGGTINVFVSGGGAAAVGQGAVAAGTGGVAVGEDVHGDVVIGGGRPSSGSVLVSPSLPAATHVLSFDRLSPLDFERLCLWLVEREGYTRAEHLGLAGSEQGRDVIAYKPTPGGDELWYFQCKRYSSIGAKTLKDEVDKYLALVEEKPGLRPVGVVFVVSCAVSARTRDAVGAYCRQHGLAYEFWALTELDMRVKRHPDLLREFFNLAA